MKSEKKENYSQISHPKRCYLWFALLAFVVVVIFAAIYCSKEFCPLHHIPLLPDRVKIVYGLPFFPEDYRNAQVANFPNAKTEVFGGCVVTPKSKGTKIVFYCPECRKAKRDWQEKHNAIK